MGESRARTRGRTEPTQLPQSTTLLDGAPHTHTWFAEKSSACLVKLRKEALLLVDFFRIFENSSFRESESGNPCFGAPKFESKEAAGRHHSFIDL